MKPPAANKRRAIVVSFLSVAVVYLLSASFLISSLDLVQHQSLLQPPAPSNKVSRESDSHHDVGSSNSDHEMPIYTTEMAEQAIRPAPWTCGHPNKAIADPLTHQQSFFAFVHIYKTAGSTLRSFFHAYAYVCHKGWMCLIGCVKVKSSSIQSQGEWEPCRVKNVMIGGDNVMEEEGTEDRQYPSVNNTVAKNNIDIIGGHFRIGTGDYVLEKKSDIHPVRHIIFLRDPVDRFVSGILYERHRDNDNLAEIVDLIKGRVRGSRAANDYWDKSSNYLLTPEQAEEFESYQSELLEVTPTSGLTPKGQFAKTRALLAIHNLARYNAIVGMTERMDESMEMLKHVLLALASEEKIEQLERYTNGTKHNESNKVSTASVVEELKKDTDFMPVFDEYVKYERMINDYAMNMHLMQYSQMKQSAGS